MSRTLDPIPSWSSRALRGLAFWLGYQDAYGIASHLSEGAIATEFLRLALAHGQGRVYEPEVMYRDIEELSQESVFTGSARRADLVVARDKRRDQEANYPNGTVEAIIEIKHGRSLKPKVFEDLDRLGTVVRLAPRIRGFLLYASVSGCRQFVDAWGTGRRSKILSTDEGTLYKVRRVCRAVSRFSHVENEPAGHFAVLVEALGQPTDHPLKERTVGRSRAR